MSWNFKIYFTYIITTKNIEVFLFIHHYNFKSLNIVVKHIRHWLGISYRHVRAL